MNRRAITFEEWQLATAEQRQEWLDKDEVIMEPEEAIKLQRAMAAGGQDD